MNMGQTGCWGRAHLNQNRSELELDSDCPLSLALFTGKLNNINVK